MNTVSLHQLVIERHAFKEEIDVLQIMLLCERTVQRVESIRIGGAVIGWDAHADEDDLRPSGLRALDERLEIIFDLLQRQAPQGIVTAELENDDFRVMHFERSR